MIDPAILRTDPDRLRESQRRRGESVELIDDLVAADVAKREAQQRFDELRNEQKVLSKQIGPLQGALKKAADDAARAQAQAEVDALMQQAQGLSDRVKEAEATAGQATEALDALWLQVSNLVNLDSPVGGEEDFTVLEEVGSPRDFAAEGFEPRDHLALGELLGAIDVERGAKVSGSRFFYLTGPGALLEIALLNLAMQQATAHGLIPMITPTLVLPSAMEGTGFLGQAAENVYRIEEDDMYLVGTSEVPLAGYHSDEILDASRLPLRYAGWSSCFRREAGSYGKDTRGIIRVHQFDKVEMFVYCRPEDAEAEHARLLQWEREFVDALEIPYRVIDVATGDLGSSAARKFDMEAWIPTQGTYREITSTSNTTEFQARRLKIRMRDENGTRPLATLNGTLCAMPRVIVAILENHQQADGSVVIPQALRPFLGGREVFTPDA
ncbi:MAG: serine--tRNA ligase [Candidatus Nanopelagicales bacterium]|nr:serine--tRNA ligase [Candidatus Nanopelagicales bacterium]MCF8537159.1 serine--tRNA ligase [Candidatus Nanopelagicales bacterium]MCF8543253.1 serine--tRNA ligase [Candidatus Nanopelagicales bacterium]MCF8556446.1 serine--tRNA ligase [Candidatus Nanopelagicales bacterium]